MKNLILFACILAECIATTSAMNSSISQLNLSGNIKFDSTFGYNAIGYNDSLILFEQNFSKNDNIPINCFLIDWLSPENSYKSIKIIYNKIYGTDKYALEYNNKSQRIEYTANKESSIFDYPPICDLINFLYRQNSDRMIKLQYIFSNPCYLCGLVPMTKCTYRVTLGLETDNPDSFTEINSPAARIRCQLLKNKTIKLSSGYLCPNGTYIDKELFIHSNYNKTTFLIRFDGINKTNTIIYNSSYYMTIPFYDYQRRSLPYPDISNNWMKFTHYLSGNSRYLKLELYEVTQVSDRKLITPMGYAEALPFGLDGPHPINTTQKGIELINENGCGGTLWFDVSYLNSYNDSQISYLRKLANNSWEVGIHFSKELNKLTLKDAKALMRDEYDSVERKIGFKPTTWCSLRSSDNISHCIFAYKELGMIWRNGESGVHAETLGGGVGNIDDDTWPSWDIFSKSGMIHPGFTHQTDKQPAIQWSISYSNFKELIQNYKELNITIIPFGKWWKINSNTYEASFNNVSFDENSLTFTINTNGYDSLIDINRKAGKTTVIYDQTIQEPVSWKLYRDGTITMWARNGHRYKVSNIT